MARSPNKCSDCPAAITPAAKRCKSCAARAKYADPAARAKMSASCKRALANYPQRHDALRQRAGVNLKRWHDDTDFFALNQRRAARQLAWCPPQRRDEYRRLRRSFGADEARRIIEDDERAQLSRRLRLAASYEQDATREIAA